MLAAPGVYVTASLVEVGTQLGVNGLLLSLAGYLFKELHRKDGTLWKIIADRDKVYAAEKAERVKEIMRLRDEVRYYRARALHEEDEAQRTEAPYDGDR